MHRGLRAHSEAAEAPGLDHVRPPTRHRAQETQTLILFLTAGKIAKTLQCVAFALMLPKAGTCISLLTVSCTFSCVVEERIFQYGRNGSILDSCICFGPYRHVRENFPMIPGISRDGSQYPEEPPERREHNSISPKTARKPCTGREGGSCGR